MVVAAALVATTVLAGLAVLQLGLAAGRPWGRLAWGGQREVLRSGLRVGSAASILAYTCFAVIVLASAGVVDLVGPGFAGVAIWVLTGYLALGVAVNGISRSTAERTVMTPVALVLALCCLTVALA